jgi:hypothetical protein
VTDGAVEWLPDTGSNGPRLGRQDGWLVADWPGLGRLKASPSRADVTFAPATDVDGDLFEKFCATELMACRRYLAGALSLHGSAVRLASGALVLVGQSGAGKSTTAAALVQRETAAFLADDVAPIDWDGAVPFVSPVKDSFWLLDDTRAWLGMARGRSRKSRLTPRERSSAAVPLTAVVHLEFDDSLNDLELTRLKGQETFLVLSQAHVCFPWDEAEAREHLEQRARLASAVPVFRMRRPRSLHLLDAMARALPERMQTTIREGSA